MKKQDITYQDKFDELVMDMRHPNNKSRVFIFVEGESDIKLFRGLFNLTHCKVECIPGGNAKLAQCMTALATHHAHIFGIRDSDFLQLEAHVQAQDNLFLTDYHDIEMTLIAEDEAFSKVIFEHADIGQESHDDIRTNIIKAIEKISLLKCLNARHDLEIQFSSAGFQDLLSFANFEVDFDQYFGRIIKKSPNAKMNEVAAAVSAIHELAKTAPHPLHLCNGHDFMKAFAAFLHAKTQRSIGDDALSKDFRLAFSKASWAKTALCASTIKWAERNNCIIY
jgi:hypothetical protein